LGAASRRRRASSLWPPSRRSLHHHVLIASTPAPAPIGLLPVRSWLPCGRGAAASILTFRASQAATAASYALGRTCHDRRKVVNLPSVLLSPAASLVAPPACQVSLKTAGHVGTPSSRFGDTSRYLFTIFGTKKVSPRLCRPLFLRQFSCSGLYVGPKRSEVRILSPRLSFRTSPSAKRSKRLSLYGD